MQRERTLPLAPDLGLLVCPIGSSLGWRRAPARAASPAPRKRTRLNHVRAALWRAQVLSSTKMKVLRQEPEVVRASNIATHNDPMKKNLPVPCAPSETTLREGSFNA